MLDCEYIAPLELKFEDDSSGRVEGYGSVFHEVDGVKDQILPGAFDGVLANIKSTGRMPSLYAQHLGSFNPLALPDGVWDTAEVDSRGLKMSGRLGPLDTDRGRQNYWLAKNGGFGGLSIAMQVLPSGISHGRGAARRQIKAISAVPEVSLVISPCNKLCEITEVKSLMGVADKDKATGSVASAMALHRTGMTGGDSMTKAEREEMWTHLQDAHEALTGQRMPTGMKAKPTTIREWEGFLRDGGFSRSEAEQFAKLVLKSINASGEDSDQATAAGSEAISAMRDALAGFRSP